MWHHQADELVKEIGNGRQTSQVTRKVPPTDVHSTAEGERGLISKHVRYQLVRDNRHNFFATSFCNSGI